MVTHAIKNKIINTFLLKNEKNILYMKQKKSKLNPYFVTGYSDGESSFSIRIRRSNKSKFAFSINPVYYIGAEVNLENLKLLESIKDFFGGVVLVVLVYVVVICIIMKFHL
jgi:hypothetical protein